MLERNIKMKHIYLLLHHGEIEAVFSNKTDLLSYVTTAVDKISKPERHDFVFHSYAAEKQPLNPKNLQELTDNTKSIQLRYNDEKQQVEILSINSIPKE